MITLRVAISSEYYYSVFTNFTESFSLRYGLRVGCPSQNTFLSYRSGLLVRVGHRSIVVQRPRSYSNFLFWWDALGPRPFEILRGGGLENVARKYG